MIYLLKRDNEEIHIPHNGKAGVWHIGTMESYSKRIAEIDKILERTPNHMDKNILLKEKRIISELIGADKMIIRNDILNAVIEALDSHSVSYKKLLECIEKYNINIEHPTSMTYQEQQTFIKKACFMLLKQTKAYN